MGVLYAVLAMVSFASNMLLTRAALPRLSLEAGFFIVLAANIVFPGLLFLVDLTRRAEPFVWNWKGAAIFAIGGIVGVFLGRRMLFDTVRTLGAARASVFHSSSPAFAFLGAWLLAGEAFALIDIVFVAIVWVGLWLTTPPSSGTASVTPQQVRRGLLVGIAAAIGFGLGNVLRGLGVREWDEALFGTAISSVAGLVAQALFTRDWSKVRSDLAAAPPVAWALYAACGVVTACGSIFVTMAMKSIQIGLAVLIVHTTPLVVIPVTAFLLRQREQMGPRALAGTALVLFGIGVLVLR